MSSPASIKLGLPKGHMKANVLELLADAGIHIKVSSRGYRPTINLPNYEVKLLKPQNILEMVHTGTRDAGFGGADWVANLGLSNVVELLDTGLDPVRIVAAAPNPNIIEESLASGRHLVIASEYETITKEWIAAKGLNATFVRAFGATESFPPEDADLIVDNTATGATLKANGLHIIDTILESSTRLYANRATLEDEAKKAVLDELVLLLKSVLTGREHSMVEFNVPRENFDEVVKAVPAMRAPTVSELHDGAGYALKIVVKHSVLVKLLPQLRAFGARDVIVSRVHQVII